MRTTLISISLALAVPAATLVLSPVAHAQPTKPADKTKTAKEYVNAGLAAQNSGDYETALTFYGKAYELVPHPVLLFNMAQAHRLAGRAKEAIDFYRKYLDADPKGTQRKPAMEFITALEVQLAAEESKRQAEAAAQAEAARQAEIARVDAARAAAEQAARDEAARAEAARVAAAAHPDPETHHPDRTDHSAVGSDRGNKPLRLAGIGTASLGVVALGAGVAFGLKARSLSNDLSQPGAIYDPAKISRGENADRNFLIATAAGGALIVAGTVMFVLGRRHHRANDGVAITALVVPDQVGLMFAGVLP
jgi:tetratricopeptide (TPR) repeat protein